MTAENVKPPKRRKKELANVSSGEVIDLGRLKLPTLKRYKQTHERKRALHFYHDFSRLLFCSKMITKMVLCISKSKTILR